MNRNEFIEQNIPLVHSCCKRFKNRDVDYEDLFQTGCVGLIKAVDGFDESLGYKFSTYAVPVILGELKRIFRDGGMIKVSRSVKELGLKIYRAKDELSKTLDREPTLNELSEKLKVSVEEITEALDALLPVSSLTIDSDDGDVQTDICDNSFENTQFDKICLKDAIEKLDTFDRKIMILRYYNSKTQQETAKALGLSQVKVSRREKVILGEIRKNLA